MKRRGLVAVQLSDVPFEQRVAAARSLARQAADGDEASDLLLAAFFPSRRVHWLPRAVVAAVLPERAVA